MCAYTKNGIWRDREATRRAGRKGSRKRNIQGTLGHRMLLFYPLEFTTEQSSTYQKGLFAINGSWFRPSGQSFLSLSCTFPLQIWFPDRIYSEEQKSHSVVTQGASICHSVCISHYPFLVLSLIRDLGDWNIDQSPSLRLDKRKGKRKEGIKKNTIELKGFLLFLFSALSIWRFSVSSCI